jgi:hypothetical protein
MSSTSTAKGETIKVTVYFWTNPPTGSSLPAGPHAQACGTVAVKASKAHGVKSGHEKHFNRMSDLQTAVEDALTGAGVTLHIPPRRPRQLYKTP